METEFRDRPGFREHGIALSETVAIPEHHGALDSSTSSG